MNPWLDRRVIPIAHRGGSREAPENTVGAFRRAAALGAKMLELDVHVTADGELVCIHDPTVDRTTDGTGRVVEMTLSEIKELDASAGFDGPRPAGIPTLREVLEAFPDVPLTVEAKPPPAEEVGYERDLARLLTDMGRGDDVIVGSFHSAVLSRIRDLAPDVATSAGPEDVVALMGAVESGETLDLGCVAAQVPIRWGDVEIVTPRFVETAHANGLAVHVWTVDDPETMRWLVEIGVDGILSDRPQVLVDLLGELGVAWSG